MLLSDSPSLNKLFLASLRNFFPDQERKIPGNLEISEVFPARSSIISDKQASRLVTGINHYHFYSVPSSLKLRCTLQLRVHCKNEGSVSIQVKYLVPIYVFPEMSCAASLFPKQNYSHVLSPNFHIHVDLSDLYIPRIGQPILLQPNRQTDPGNI
jgi:hypothetical protein